MQNDAIEIRLLTPADAGVLDRVDSDVFDNPIQPRLAEWYLASPNNHLVVAIESEEVVGMASAISYVHPDKPLQMFINEVGVSGTLQRQGLGKRLVGRLLDLARAMGCHEVWVATEEGNTSARALYASVLGREDPDRAVVYTWCLQPEDD